MLLKMNMFYFSNVKVQRVLFKHQWLVPQVKAIPLLNHEMALELWHAEPGGSRLGPPLDSLKEETAGIWKRCATTSFTSHKGMSLQDRFLLKARTKYLTITTAIAENKTQAHDFEK